MNNQPSKHFSKKYAQWIVLGFFLFANVFIWMVVERADSQGELTVAFLDVGQGDAIYIEAPNGNQLLIDGGTGQQVLRELGRVMPFYDRSIDIVLSTHPDQDHVGGLPAVLERMRVDNVITTENTSDTGAYRAFENIIRKKNPRRILARIGTRIVLDRGVVLEILFPESNTRGFETNTASIVARLTYGEQSFLLTGDSPISIEKYLVGKNGGKLKSTVLKLGHHGSRTSSSKIFLAATDPEYAVISAGKDNKYGHPHAEVVAFLEELKIPHLNTADRGTIIFKTDGTDLRMK